MILPWNWNWSCWIIGLSPQFFPDIQLYIDSSVLCALKFVWVYTIYSILYTHEYWLHTYVCLNFEVELVLDISCLLTYTGEDGFESSHNCSHLRHFNCVSCACISE